MIRAPVKSNDELVHQIIAYWADRGYAVRIETRLVKLSPQDDGRRVILSDMKNGLPRDAWNALDSSPGR